MIDTDEIIKSVAKDTGIDIDVVKAIDNSQYLFLINMIKSGEVTYFGIKHFGKFIHRKIKWKMFRNVKK